MRALKCDVCGKLYECGKNNAFAYIGKNTGYAYYGRVYDSKFCELCPECFKKVKQVLRINDESEDETV